MSGAHSPAQKQSTAHGRRYVVALGIGVALVAGAVGVTVVGHSSGGKVSATPTTTPPAQPATSKLPLNVVAVTPC